MYNNALFCAFITNFLSFKLYIVPSRPPVVTEAMVISPMEVKVSWLEVDPIHQNGIITVYEVDYLPLVNFSFDIRRVNTTNTTIVLMDLHESVQYNITVRAFTSVGGGPFSNPVASVTHEAGITFPPPPPPNHVHRLIDNTNSVVFLSKSSPLPKVVILCANANTNLTLTSKKCML